VLRDVDLLSGWKHDRKVYISICSVDEDALRRLDPGAPSGEERFAVLWALRYAGFGVGLNALPWIPDVTQALANMEEITTGVDAIEVRADLLRTSAQVGVVGPQVPPRAYVASQISAIRQHTALPIVFTARTVSQGGVFPDAGFARFDMAIVYPDGHVDLTKGDSDSSYVFRSPSHSARPPDVPPLRPGDLHAGSNPLADPDSFLTRDGCQNADHRVLEDPATVEVLLSEAAVVDAVRGEPVQVLQRLQHAFARALR